jgi:hypothetical protein
LFSIFSVITKNLKYTIMVSKAQEKQWQAESDAEVMARYQEILEDKTRMARAMKVAKQRAEDLTKRANAMQSVARTKVSGRKK